MEKTFNDINDIEFEISDVYEFDTAQGKVKIKGAKFVITHLDKDDILKITKADLSIGVKMTAIRNLVEKKSEQEYEERIIREMFSNWFYFSGDDVPLKDFEDFMLNLANFCVEEIKNKYAQPKEEA